MTSWTNSKKEDPDFKPLILKDGLVMMYDYVMMNGGRIIHNEGSWGNEKVHQRRVTCDDMEIFCMYHNDTCRITDLGKKVITIDMPNESPFFLCSYHSFEHALVERFTTRGEIVINRLSDNAHP